MADLFKRMAGPTALGTTAATLYTVPASTTAVVRNIQVTNTNANAAITFTLSIGTDATGTRIFSGVSVGAADVGSWSGSFVLAAGEIIQGFASVAGLNVTISGVEVS